MPSSGLQAANNGNPSRRVATVVRADARTGRLVRSIAASPKPVAPRVPASAASLPANPPMDDLVQQAAATYGVDPLLVHSVIRVESNYNPYAVSPKGAEGLMQLVPSTARDLGVKDSFNPKENIEAGVRYLKYLQTVFGDDRLALAAYNAGPGAVNRYKNIPPYPETVKYVYQVGKRYDEARRAADSKKAAEVPAVATAPAEPPQPVYRGVEQYQDEQGRLYIRTK